jgi:tetratricopeptide (TPR) repeat protein
MALVEKADDQPEQARETLIRALSYQPAHPAANYNLGLLYEESGMMAKAYDHYTTFLAHAGPEFGSRLTDVRRKIDQLAPRLTLPGR